MVRRIFVGNSWSRVRRQVPDFDPMKDMYVSTSSTSSRNKLMSMLPRAEYTYLMDDAEVGGYWPEVRDALDYRLIRSRERIEDCQRWPSESM